MPQLQEPSLARTFLVISFFVFLLGGCASRAEAPAAPATPETKKVGVVLASAGENDKGFNEYILKGARQAAADTGLDFAYITTESDENEASPNIEKLITDGADFLITVGFAMADATAEMAQKYPDLRFAIVDNAYTPGQGCSETVQDCYSAQGGLSNVTSLMFAEDEVGYLAGVLAACVSQTKVIASVAGKDIPPVVRFVRGYQNGAKSVQPNIVTLNIYIPDFGDSAAGQLAGQDFIDQGADVIFGVAGITGNGALVAAKEAGVMAIGVDVDQYLSYPAVQEALITSAVKNVDVAAASAVTDFAHGTLQPGVRLATVASGGVGLAPYHDWEARIPQACKERVAATEAAIKADPTITGAK